MKKFRDSVWIPDKDYELIVGVTPNRKMTEEEYEAYSRASDLYWDKAMRRGHILAKLFLFVVVAIIALFGFFMGYIVWGAP